MCVRHLGRTSSSDAGAPPGRVRRHHAPSRPAAGTGCMGSVGPVKVEGAELLTVELPLVTPFRTSYATSVVERKLLVRLGTDAGTGWGECGAPAEPLYTSEYGDAARHVLVHHLLPRLAEAGEVTPDDVAHRAGAGAGPPDGQGRAGDGGARRLGPAPRPIVRVAARLDPDRRARRGGRRRDRVRRRAARRRRGLRRRGLSAGQAEGAAGLGRRAGGRGPRALRTGPGPPGRRQRRVRALRRRRGRAGGPRPLRPAAHRAAPRRGRPGRSRRARRRRWRRRSASTSP